MRSVRVLAALTVVSGAVMVSAPAASAQAIPPEVQQVIDQLPPEYQEGLGQVLTDTFTAMTAANIDGVAQASSAPGNSSAYAVDYPGLITVNKVQTTKSSSKVTRLSVGGMDLLVKDGNATGGTNSGDLAAVGDAIDQTNTALCPAGRNADGNCITVMDAKATTGTTPTTSGTNTASSSVASVGTGKDAVFVLPNSALTNKTRFFGDKCTDFATASLLGGRGTGALLSLLGLKVKSGGVFKPC